MVSVRELQPSPDQIQKSISDEIRVIENSSNLPTKRSWQQCLVLLNLNKIAQESWSGLKILDVGSGFKEDDPALAFPGATICAIDPNFGEKIDTKEHTAHEKRKGTAQYIPYDDNSFDLVISTFTVPIQFIKNDLSWKLALLEMIRVMKYTGQIRLAPCEKDYIGQIRAKLEENGFSLDTSQTGFFDRIQPLAIITAKEGVLDSDEQKDAAWSQLYKDLVGNER